MLVSRTFQLGLIVFAVVLLVGTVVEKAQTRDEAPRPIANPAAAVTVVDVAHGVSWSELANFVHLDADESVIVVDDQKVANDMAAGAAIAARGNSGCGDAGKFLDLTVQGPRGTRRVLVLLH